MQTFVRSITDAELSDLIENVFRIILLHIVFPFFLRERRSRHKGMTEARDQDRPHSCHDCDNLTVCETDIWSLLAYSLPVFIFIFDTELEKNLELELLLNSDIYVRVMTSVSNVPSMDWDCSS